MNTSNCCKTCGLICQSPHPAKPCACKAPTCGCPRKKKKCGDGFAFRKVVIPAAFGDDETGEMVPVNGNYTNSLVEYAANRSMYMYDSYGVFTKISSNSFDDLDNVPEYDGVPMSSITKIPSIEKAVAKEASERKKADKRLQQEIDDIKAGSDVTDVVGTYAELQHYDTSRLNDNDIIKVLQDETHDDAIAYYRYDKETNTFSLIGFQGPYYTQTQTNDLLALKQDKLTAGDGIEIDEDGVISITEFSDGTYQTSATLSKVIADSTTVGSADVPTLDFDDLVINETLIYDLDGTVGVVTAVSGANLTVVTITTAGSKDITFIAPAYDDTKTYAEGDVVTYDGKRYVANTNIDPAESWDPTHWTEEDVQTALDNLDGDSTAKYNYTTNIAVGGIPVGTQIHDTDLLADIIKQMLVTTYYPTYVAPSASLAYSVNTYIEVGTSVDSKAATVSYNAGAINLQGVKQNDRGGAATKYYVYTTGADTEFSDDSTSSGTFTVPALTRSTKGDITITGKVDYAAGPQPLDSNGDPYGSPLPAGSVTATKTFSFIQPFYYGRVAGTSISDFTGLIKDVSAKGQKKYKYTTNNEHMVIAYDSSYGNLTSILDPNGFEVISGWSKSTLTVDGFSYYVWIADSATTDTNAEFTFKF